jgi:hypothetical protein
MIRSMTVLCSWLIVFAFYPQAISHALEPWPQAAYQYTFEDQADDQGNFGQVSIVATNGAAVVLFVNDGFTTASTLKQPRAMQPPTFTFLLCPDGSQSYPQGMNTMTRVVGQCIVNSTPQAFLFRPGNRSEPMTLFAVPRRSRPVPRI